MSESNTVLVPESLQTSGYSKNILLTAKGGSVLFVGKLFTYGSRFVITFLLARLLGAEQYGLYNVALSAAAIASSLAMIGLDSALTRYVALAASRRDEAGVWGAIQVGVGVPIFLSVLTSTGLFALAYLVADQVFHEPRLAPVLQLISLIVPFLTLSDVLAGATRGFKSMQYMAIAQNFVQPLVKVTLILAFAVIGLNILKAVLIFGLADLSASLLLLYYLNRQFSLKRPLKSARRKPGEMLSFSVSVWLSEMMMTLRSSVQTILLGTWNTVATVGIFSVASQLNLFADLVQSSVTTAAKPLIVELHDQGHHEQLGRLYQTISKWMFAFNLPVFLIVVLFPAPILSIFGRRFVDGSNALTLLACASLIDAGTGMCGAILDMTGYARLKLINSIIRLVLTMGLNVLLIPAWGMVGAAVAALIGEAAINSLRLIQVFVLFRLLPYSPSFLGAIGAGLVALVPTVALGYWHPVEGKYSEILLQILVLVTVYLGLMFRVGVSAEDRVVLARLRHRASRKFARI